MYNQSLLYCRVAACRRSQWYPAEGVAWCGPFTSTCNRFNRTAACQPTPALAARHEQPADKCVETTPSMAEARPPCPVNTDGLIEELPSSLSHSALYLLATRLGPAPIQNSRAPNSATFCASVL